MRARRPVVRRDVLDRSRDAELAELQVDGSGRRPERFPIRRQQRFERLHLLARILVDDAPQPRLRQPSASVQERRRALGLDPRPHLTPDVRLQAMALQAVELERLLVLQRQVVELQPHPEPFAEEVPGGIGEESHQVGEIDAAAGRVRLRQLDAGEAGPRLEFGRRGRLAATFAASHMPCE